MPDSGIYDIEINYPCNNNCLNCPKDRDGGELSFDEIKEFLDSNITPDSRITITGGEPTIHPDFIRIMEYAAKSGAPVNLLTNGRRFSDRGFLKTVLETGPESVNIPLYSSVPEIHEQLTLVPGSFSETVAGIRNLFQFKSAGYPVKIVLKLLFCKTNIETLPGTVRFVVNEFRQPDVLMLQPMNMRGQAYEHKDNLFIRLTESAPYIARAAETGVAARQHIILKEIPPCLFPNPEHYFKLLPTISNNYQKTYGPDKQIRESPVGGTTIKSSLCRECLADKLCNGVWFAYSKLAGLEELKPVKNLLPSCLKR